MEKPQLFRGEGMISEYLPTVIFYTGVGLMLIGLLPVLDSQPIFLPIVFPGVLLGAFGLLSYELLE